jgi:hypothetical protein
MSGDFGKLNLMVRTLSIFEIPQNFTQLVRMIVSLTITSDDNSIAVVDGDDRLSNSKAVNRISYV